MSAGDELMDDMVQSSHVRDDRNPAAMSTLREPGTARLRAFDTDRTAWGEQFETTHRVRFGR